MPGKYEERATCPDSENELKKLAWLFFMNYPVTAYDNRRRKKYGETL